MIELKWFYFLLFNLFRRWPIKTDFVLTTLATRKQSQIFPQHIAPETPWQHVCDCFFFLNHLCSQLFWFVYNILSKQWQKKEEKNKWSQETCPPLKTTCRLSQCRETHEIKKEKEKRVFSFRCLSFCVHFFSCLFIFLFFSFIFISCISLSLKKPLPI